MNKGAEQVSAVLRNDLRFLAVGVVAFLVGLFLFNIITLPPPLSLFQQIIYGVISLILIADYIFAFLYPEIMLQGNLKTLILASGLEIIALLFITYLLGHRAIPYFVLMMFDFYALARYRSVRMALFTLVSVLAITIFSLSIFLGFQDALSVFLNHLPWFGIAVLTGEVATRQWKTNEKIESVNLELEQAYRQLQAFTEQVEQLAVVKERSRLAHEIHDSLGHALTGLDMQMELLRHLPAGQTARQEAETRARALVKECLRDLRRAVQAMGPKELESLSLPQALQTLVARQTATCTQFNLQIEGEQPWLPLDAALLLYRAAQEGLTNIQRHAPGAAEATIRLTYLANETALSITNSPPRQVAPASPGGGHGLAGIQERVEAMGGNFAAASTPEGGFTLSICLPLLEKR